MNNMTIRQVELWVSSPSLLAISASGKNKKRNTSEVNNKWCSYFKSGNLRNALENEANKRRNKCFAKNALGPHPVI